MLHTTKFIRQRQHRYDTFFLSLNMWTEEDQFEILVNRSISVEVQSKTFNHITLG